MNNQNQPMQTGKTCSCVHHNIMPALIVLFGLTFLLGAFNILSAYAVGMIWPILVIIGGVVKMKGRSCKCC